MKKSIEIVMLGGDSITARGDWKELLKNEHIVNLGIDGGDCTKGVLSRVTKVVELEPKIVFLMIGVNDLCTSIPLETVFENYKKILKSLESENINLIVQAVFITQMKAVNKKIEEFNSLLKEYCEKQGLIFVDLNDSFKNEENLLREDLTTDGLHLGQKAYKAWAYKLNKYIKV